MEKAWGWIVAGFLFVVLLLNYRKIKGVNTLISSRESSGNGNTNNISLGDKVIIDRSNLDCSKVSGLTGTVKLGDQEFYCAGTFQCNPDGSVTCVNPTYYYYPYYYPYFRFFRRGHHGGGHHGGGGPGVGGPGGPGSGTGGGTGGGVPGSGTGGGADGGSMANGGIVYRANDRVVVNANDLDCAKVSGLSGKLQFGDHQFYCAGTFQCAPNGAITCRNPQYYYYPYNYYPYYGYRQFPFLTTTSRVII